MKQDDVYMEHVTYPPYVHMSVQEGFLEERTGFLKSLTLFAFTFLPHSYSYYLIQVLFVEHLNYSNSFPIRLAISTFILIPNTQLILY